MARLALSAGTSLEDFSTILRDVYGITSNEFTVKRAVAAAKSKSSTCHDFCNA